jgi:hypothetical protein
MQTVYEADSVFLAHLVQEFLRKEGIECVVEGEALWDFDVGGRLLKELMPLTVRVLRDGDRDRALRLLEERRRAFGGTWDGESAVDGGTSPPPGSDPRS